MLTQEYLKSVLDYNPETGVFTWNKARRGVRIGLVTGYINKEGYSVIKVKNKLYKSHRLAWLYMYGYFPINDIDHINHDKADNRIINLREATESQNMQNKIAPSINNKCGFLGVCFKQTNKKYVAQIRINGKVNYLGLFETPEAAHEAYLKAKRELHEFCTI